MNYENIRVEIDANGIGQVILNRPDVRNAFNEIMISEIAAAMDTLSQDEAVRVVVLKATGKAFSAGADLSMMQSVATYSEAENKAEGLRLAGMLHAIDHCQKPTLALVNGPAIGGGVGLIAACDIALASKTAFFALSEVRLGLVPAVISPFVLRAIGPRQAQRYFLSAERFDASEAKRIGLVHQSVAPEALEEAGEQIIANLLNCGPEALKAAKALIAQEREQTINAGQRDRLASLIASLRASPEGQEGIAAFLEKRAPNWTAPQ